MMVKNRRRIGIDLGGTKIEGVALDERMQPLWRERIATESEHGYDHILDRLSLMAAQLRAVVPEATVLGIGTPGSISMRDGTMKNCNTTCLNGRRLHNDIAARLDMEVRLENDANLFALSEALAGAGRGASLVFGVIMGTGVGGGIVHKGELLTGAQHLAGEWGHHAIDGDGPYCYCGRRGCVESFFSGRAVQRQYRDRSGHDADMATIIAAYRRGESGAGEVVERFFDRFGRALANVVNILDPDTIVLGGGLSNINELYTLGRQAVERYVFNDELRTPIVRNQLGDSAGVIGAALLA